MSDPARSFSTRLAAFITRARWPLLALSLLLVGGLGSGIRLLTMNADYRVFFSEANPQLAAFEALQEVYSKDDNILIGLEPADGNVFTAERLAMIDALVREGWQIPFVSRVEAITNFQVLEASGDDIAVRDLVRDAHALSTAEVAAIRTAVLAEPQLVDRLVSPRGDITAVNLTLKFPGERIGEELEAIAAVRARVAALREAHPDVQVHVSGVAMLFAGFSEVMERDMGTLIPAMFAAVLLIVALATRSLTGTLGTLLIVFLSIISAMGAGGYLGIQFTAPIASVPTMIMTLAVADCVHVLNSAQRALARGLPRVEAVSESVTLNAAPILITGATTAIGFLSMNFSDVPPFRDLGNMTAIGILAAAALSLTLFPALLTLLPFRAATAHPLGARVGTLLARLGGGAATYHKTVLAAGLVLVVGATVLATRNELNDEMVKYLDTSTSFRRDTDHLSERLTGIYTVEFSVEAGTSGGITDPEYLRRLEAFRGWLAAQPAVTHVASFDEVARRINRAMHGGGALHDRLPADPDQAAQYLLMYEMSLPYGQDLNNQINVDRSATRVVATVGSLPSEELIALAEAGDAWLREHGPTAAAGHGISMPLIFAHLARRQTESMVSGTLWSVLLIAGLLTAVLRSARLGAIALVAIVAPMLAAFGIWALIHGQITAGMSLVAGMSLGIIDDDVVHFISKYRRAALEHREGAVAAVRHAIGTVGWDLIVTTGALIIGFAILAQSSFGLFFDLAKLTAITLGMALLFNLIFLPALLVWADRWTLWRRPAVAAALVAGLALLFPWNLDAQALPSLWAWSNPTEARGLEIASEARRRDRGWQSSVVDLRMILRNAHGQTSERRMRSASLEVPGDGDRTLVTFAEPADVRGTAVLTYSHPLQTDDQWLYLPSVRRVKRIASSSKAGPFMGSEFAFEDLASQEVERYTWDYVAEERLDSLEAFVVDRDPVDPLSGYARQRVWYERQTYRPLRIDYYDRRNALLKTLTYEAYQRYGEYWRARRLQMVNHRTGKSTVVEFGEYRLHAGLRAAEFDPARLGIGR